MTQPIALVTGASAGIGADFARQLSADGARLVLVARRKERIEALAAELGNARAVTLDLSQPDAAEPLMADLSAHGEHVDLLVNNAGFGLASDFAEQDRRRVRQMIDLNCGVLTELCHAVLPGMIERRRGGILNVASVAAFQPGPHFAVYCATKAYVLSFTEALHEEVREHGIHVTALCPGPVRTEFADVAQFSQAELFNRIGADSAKVAAAGLAGVDRNQAVVLPGALAKLGAQSGRLLPRGAVRRVAGMMRM